jgi:hypothetical protein
MAPPLRRFSHLLSMLPFQPAYLCRIMGIAGADAEANADETAAVLAS